MVSILFNYILWLLITPIFILLLIFYIRTKKRGKIEIRIIYIGIGICSIVFFKSLFSSPNITKRIKEYNNLSLLNSNDVEMITLVRTYRIGGLEPIQKTYKILEQNKIEEFIFILKMNEFDLVEGNLQDNKYWEVLIKTKSSKKFKYSIIDSPKNLYIEIVLDGKRIGSYKNNYLRPLLNNY